jgi:hypothetical protein
VAGIVTVIVDPIDMVAMVEVEAKVMVVVIISSVVNQDTLQWSALWRW